MAKEAYLYSKRGLFIWQKRPIYMAKEACLYGKRGLFIWQKRPIYMPFERRGHIPHPSAGRSVMDREFPQDGHKQHIKHTHPVEQYR